MNNWISVKDRLPKAGDTIACLLKTGLPFTANVIKDDDISKEFNIDIFLVVIDESGDTEREINIEDVTHWMPLPELPEEVEK